MNQKQKAKSTTSSLTDEELELKIKIFQNKDYPTATRQYTRDGFLDESCDEDSLKIESSGYLFPTGTEGKIPPKPWDEDTAS